MAAVIKATKATPPITPPMMAPVGDGADEDDGREPVWLGAGADVDDGVDPTSLCQ